MRKLTRKGITGIELSIVMVILAGLFTMTVEAVKETKEGLGNIVVAQTVLEKEAREAIDFIQTQKIDHGEFLIEAEYISKYESEVEIETINCEDQGSGQKIYITQKNTEETYTVNTCKLVKNKIKFELQA